MASEDEQQRRIVDDVLRVIDVLKAGQASHKTFDELRMLVGALRAHVDRVDAMDVTMAEETGEGKGDRDGEGEEEEEERTRLLVEAKQKATVLKAMIDELRKLRQEIGILSSLPTSVPTTVAVAAPSPPPLPAVAAAVSTSPAQKSS
jgi:hypothetical protein